jgi:hypothetical protein
MKLSKRFILSLCLAVVPVSGAAGQVWNSNAGGWNTGYGTVYGTFGLAQATQNMYNTMQMNMQRAVMRQAMINKWGRAAVEKAEREARSGSRTGSSSTAASAGPVVTDAPPEPKNYWVFRPDATVDTGRVLADALGSTAEEKTLIKTIFSNTKTAYERETAAKGWKNNIAGGLTFFTVAAMTVYRDAEEPSDEAVEIYYHVVNRSIDEMPAFASVSNKDKQQFNNVMIGFAGLLLAGYTEGKQNSDAETVGMYRRLAGELIKMVLKIEPDRLKLRNGMIVIE